MTQRRQPVWRNWAFLAGLALIPVLMVTVDGPLSSMMRSIDGPAKEMIDLASEPGDSKFSLVPSGVAFLLLMALYFVDANTVRARVLAWLAAASGFVFVAIAYSGILTNVIKILVGRPRPRYAENLNWPEFYPLAFKGDLHSFPSGHGNTVFAIALALGFFAPRLRPYLLVAAALIAFCRVLQFQHFISDSLGGALLAIVTTYWLRDAFARRHIVFQLRKDGRIMFTAPGRLFVRWCRAVVARKPKPAAGAMNLEAAGRGD